MQKRGVILFFLLLVLVFISSCGAFLPIEIPEERSDIVGIWRAAGISLEIAENGYVQWEKIEGNSRSTISAPLKKITDTNMIIGIGFIKKEFRVNHYPYIEDGSMLMEIDGITLVKSPF